jgi:hypothetical protein
MEESKTASAIASANELLGLPELPTYEFNGKEFSPGMEDYFRLANAVEQSMLKNAGISSHLDSQMSLREHIEKERLKREKEIELRERKKISDFMKASPLSMAKNPPYHAGGIVGSGIASAGTGGPLPGSIPYYGTPGKRMMSHVETFLAGAALRFSSSTGMKIALYLEKVETVEGQGVNLVLVHDSVRHEAMRVFDTSSFPRDHADMEKEILEKVMVDGIMNLVARILKVEPNSI